MVPDQALRAAARFLLIRLHQGVQHGRNPFHLLLLRRRLRRHHRAPRRPHHRRAGRPGAPRQLRPAVHQGLHPAPFRRAGDPRRARPPSRAARRTRPTPPTGELGYCARPRRRAFRRHHPGPWAGRRGGVWGRPAPHRGLLRLQQAGEGPHRHQQSRHQFPPVHVQRGGRRQDDAGGRGAAMKLVVIDPRRTDTAEAADLHLALLPGTDIALYNSMLHVMLWEGWIARDYVDAHTEGFDALKKIVREYTPTMAAALCGLTKQQIEQAAQWFATSRATLSMYCQGLNQFSFGSHNNAALINLHLASGQIGRPGAGPFSLTGQPNAMGGRETGGMANLLSAHRDLANPQHRAEVAALWGVDSVPEKPGKRAVELFQALKSGEVKAVWITCTNPAQSLPDQTLVHEALATAEFVVVQEAFAHTETCRYADLLLPATTWGEKEGTVTNSERRISRVLSAVPAPGEARHDWAVGVDFARRLGARLGKAELAQRMFPYARPEEIWNEHRESTRDRDLDITGLNYAILESRGPQQWPYPQGARAGRVRLYEDGVFPTPSGKARFVATEYHPTAEVPSARYPLHLITGRLRDQWHGMSRTGLVARLYNHEPEPRLSMHRDDMARRGLEAGDLVKIRARRGDIIVKVADSASLRPGQCFLPMHWGANAMGGLGVNTLTPPDFDPYSKQPELKHAVVQVEKFVEGRSLAALRRVDCEHGANPLELMQRLRPWMAGFH